MGCSSAKKGLWDVNEILQEFWNQWVEEARTVRPSTIDSLAKAQAQVMAHPRNETFRRHEENVRQMVTRIDAMIAADAELAAKVKADDDYRRMRYAFDELRERYEVREGQVLIASDEMIAALAEAATQRERAEQYEADMTAISLDAGAELDAMSERLKEARRRRWRRSVPCKTRSALAARLRRRQTRMLPVGSPLCQILFCTLSTPAARRSLRWCTRLRRLQRAKQRGGALIWHSIWRRGRLPRKRCMLRRRSRRCSRERPTSSN